MARAPKRFVRLKETTPLSDVWHTPTEKYRRGTDGTLGDGQFHARGDANGFLRTGNASTRGPALYLLGGSFVESLFEPEETRFAARLERLLADGGQPHRVFNAGYSGSTSLQLFNVLLNKVVPLLRPNDTVVFFVPPSDTDILGVEGSYWTWTDRHAPIIPVGTQRSAPGSREEPDWQGLHRLLALVHGVARQFRINLILATTPWRRSAPDEPYLLKQFPDRERRSRILDLRFGLGDAVRKFAGTHPLMRFADLESRAGTHPEWFYDHFHLNSAGHEAVAGLIHRELGPLMSGGRRWYVQRVRRRTRLLWATSALQASERVPWRRATPLL